ncbi:hypothetical protein PT277_05255 [Acetobacteraceae bacterium ESL0709]|nr:hypothetical protein [Acetobacteraceae bacterium ESL0697]MDF7678103.1 hypothetical protein [Acetobacteraceae bacterium ESL0709]
MRRKALFPLAALVFLCSTPFALSKGRADLSFDKAKSIFIKAYKEDSPAQLSDHVINCFTYVDKMDIHPPLSPKNRARICYYLDAVMFTLDQMRRLSEQEKTGKDPGPATFYFDPKQAHVRLTILAIDMFPSLKNGQDHTNKFVKSVIDDLKASNSFTYDVPLSKIKIFY